MILNNRKRYFFQLKIHGLHLVLRDFFGVLVHLIDHNVLFAVVEDDVHLGEDHAFCDTFFEKPELLMVVQVVGFDEHFLVRGSTQWTHIQLEIVRNMRDFVNEHHRIAVFADLFIEKGYEGFYLLRPDHHLVGQVYVLYGGNLVEQVGFHLLDVEFEVVVL